ncbi:MAG: YabP/YqfC family sporulation protein [Clostridia bacterium]|nr:YabP/YqfC family sporulation protein [Clostridia bacterium]
MKNKKQRLSRINEILEFPNEIGTNEPKITMAGFNKLLIENYKGILEYEEFFIKINTHIGIININGFNLELNNLTDDDILVTGKIDSIDIEENID